ncbi:hypothetical protein [Streptomyces sp. NPDC050428]|uniref:DUF6197 family protein n=1 Tax=Streptomyces sp. NPDC050428 TaxID=3155757 RepID=UPI0034190627
MTTTTAVDVAAVCDLAADVIIGNGYCRTFTYDTSQASAGTALEFCRVGIDGAVNIALQGTPRYVDLTAERTVRTAIEARITAPSLAAWCSYRGNSKTQAVRLLRDTAADLRERSRP